ncbi:hypothetical protein BBJ28_00004663 [Nothophytophthora sp. Chile5]|nr:hypothetical protein BBJ28_00004663 [Nothophytophthora sp. Chile5]
MEAKATHEMERLLAIEQKVKTVQDTLNTRLPPQHRHLAALVCGAKWRLQTQGAQDAEAMVKKVRTELGAFDYRSKEQAELLTRYLFELDDILSYGDNKVKAARKALVLFIQSLLQQADAFKDQSAKLKQFGEDALRSFLSSAPKPSSPSNSGSESDDMHVKDLFDEGEEAAAVSVEEDESDGDEEDEEADDQVEADEEMEDETPEKQEGDDELMQQDAGEDDEEEEEEDEEVAPPQKKSPRLHPSRAPRADDMDIDVNSLPVWKPYYQLQRRQDGIYLMARLRNTDPRNLRVEWNNQTGVLRISGFKLPTQRDIMVSRLSGAPTFGRFEIAEQFPANMLDMDEATQEVLEDGTLQIRMPYYQTQNPLRYRRSSLFQPRDCFVW